MKQFISLIIALIIILPQLSGQKVYRKVSINLNPSQQADFTPDADSVKKAVLAYAKAERGTDTNLKLDYLKESPGGWHFTFRHFRLADDTPIAGSGIKANLNKEGRIVSLMDNLSTLENVIGDFPESFSPQLVSSMDGLISFKQQAVYYPSDKGLLPAYEVRISLEEYPFSKTYILDANTQRVLYEQDMISGYEPYAPQEDTSAKALVFLPNPITKARATYGDFLLGSFLTDQFDANLANLANLRDTVVLQELTYENGLFQLKGPYVSVEDIGKENFPVATSSDNTFYFTRDQSFFEDVMCYYHIDSFQRYIQSLGFTTLHNYPVRVDAHGLEDTDGSGFFVRGEEAYILFGDGGVDDAEDADVIIHEYGHALSYDAIGFTPSGFEHRAVDEGFSDYIAARYSQQLSDFEWFNLFNWDGHNEFWPGRVANGIQTYPPSGTNVYDFGGIWTSVLTDLHQELGGDITDRLILQEVYSNYRGMEIGDAAMLFMEADSLLYDGAHADMIQFAFCQRNLLAQGSCLSVSNEDILTEENSIKLFPNPNTGTFLLQADPTFRELTIDMYALTGQRVFSESWNPTSGNKEFSPTLSPGIYQVLIYEQNNLVSHEKMVILKH